jgi:DNA-binding SARP family transcriptional activator
MSHLQIRLLGPPQVFLGGKAITAMRSDKVRALLGYLSIEFNQPHRREKLAGLLWPDYPEASARASLRRALADMRKVIGDEAAIPHYLHITRQIIQFNPESDVWVDAVNFSQLTRIPAQQNPETIQDWVEAVELYEGEFMEGFSLPDCAIYEEL